MCVYIYYDVIYLQYDSVCRLTLYILDCIFFFYCPAQTGGSGGSGDTSLGGSLPPLNKSLGGNGDVTMAQGLGISMGKYGLGNK